MKPFFSANVLRVWLERLRGGLRRPPPTGPAGDPSSCVAPFQEFLRHAPAAIAFKGLDGRFLMVNPSYESFLGRPAAEILGRTLEELVPVDVCGPCLAIERTVVATRQDDQAEEEWPGPDGHPSIQLVQRFPLVDASGRCLGLGIIRSDITGRKHSEQARLQARNLESLGILAGGLAHDFNNLLGAMAGNVELAMLAAAPDAPVAAHLRTLEDLVERSAGLVRQILACAGRSQTAMGALDLNQQVEDMLRLLRSSLPRRADLRVDTTPGLPAIHGDSARIQQVVMNLVLNAAEAVEDGGGMVTVRTGLDGLDAARIARHFPGQGLAPGDHVFLEVADTGSGMPPEVLERIFDPFYSTKYAGRGLGLSAVLGTVRAHRGGIQVHSEPGHGTTFRLLFPAAPAGAAGPADQGAAEPAPAALAQAAACRGSGVVLVVDDEAPLRTAAAQALALVGFTPLEAGDGLEALQVFEANRDRLRAIVLDLTMPRMDGEEAYRELRGHGSMVPVFLASGFAETEVMSSFRSRGITGFLQKPYRLGAMVQSVCGALAREEVAARTGLAAPRKPLGPVAGLDLGAPILGRQHLQLIGAYNRLAAAAGPGGRRPQQERALAAMTELALTHFGVEETLMERVAYPRTRDHQQAHARLLNQIDDIAGRLRRGSLALTPAVLDFLECWVVHHCQDDDWRLAQFLRGPGH